MIGVISAMPFEKQRLVELIDLEKEVVKCEIGFSFGKINTTSVVIAACGEGKVNAARCAQIMICCFDVKAVINIGVAGSMSGSVKKGDIVIASAVAQHDYNMTAMGVPVGLVPLGTRTDEYPWGDKASVYTGCSQKMIDIASDYFEKHNIHYHIGKIATGDIFVADSELKKRILADFDVLACEMEGAAIGYVCKCAGVSFAEIRDISDAADDNANDSYWLYRQNYSLSKMLYEILYNCEEGLL